MKPLNDGLVAWVATEVKNLPCSFCAHPAVAGSCLRDPAVVLMFCFSVICLQVVLEPPAQARSFCCRSSPSTG